MAASVPDPSASMFDSLPKSARQLLLVSAERGMLIANGALGQLKDGPSLTPAAAAEWHEKVLTEAARAIFKAWETIEPSDHYLAAAWGFMALLDQHLRQGEMGISYQRQHDQLLQPPAGEGQSPAAPNGPASGSTT